MQYKTLGKSSLNISTVSMGCMSLEPDQAPAEKLIQTALNQGINFFDTADLYDKGINEEIVGKALRGKRDQIFLATKGGNQWRSDGSGWDWNASRQYIITAAEQSLKRLRTDYIDLYQLHGGTIEDPIDETIDAFETLRKQGKIRYYGISSIRPNVIREYIKRSNIVSVMKQYSLLDQRPAEEILPLLHAHNIGVLARGTLASGLLVSKPAKSYLGYTENQVADGARAVHSLTGNSHTPTGIAIQFALQTPAITSAVVGIRTARQLTEAIAAAGQLPLTSQQVDTLTRAVPAKHYQDHR